MQGYHPQNKSKKSLDRWDVNEESNICLPVGVQLLKIRVIAWKIILLKIRVIALTFILLKSKGDCIKNNPIKK